MPRRDRWWAVMQPIADWLKKLGLPEHAERFAENRIDLSVLPDLTDQHLEKLGVALLDRPVTLRVRKVRPRERPRRNWRRGGRLVNVFRLAGRLHLPADQCLIGKLARMLRGRFDFFTDGALRSAIRELKLLGGPTWGCGNGATIVRPRD